MGLSEMNKILCLLQMLILGVFAENGLDLNFQQSDYVLKYERLELNRFNKDLVEYASLVTFKFNRTTALTNATLILKVDAGPEVVGIIQAYKFMSNEYRYFPLRFSAHALNAWNSNIAGIKRFTKCGNFTGPPIIKGRRYHICNWSPDTSKLPPLIPDGQYKLEIQVLYSSVEMFFVSALGSVSRPIYIP